LAGLVWCPVRNRLRQSVRKHRIDLDRIDALGAPHQRAADVVAGAGADRAVVGSVVDDGDRPAHAWIVGRGGRPRDGGDVVDAVELHFSGLGSWWAGIHSLVAYQIP
jgi:hypothetical protein